MREIVRYPGYGTRDVTFGDEDRMYQLLEKAEENNVHHFELRVDNSPNETFAEFDLTMAEDVTEEQVFEKGFDTASEEIAKQIEDPANFERYLDGLRHLHSHIEDVRSEYADDFTKAVGQIEEQNSGLEQ